MKNIPSDKYVLIIGAMKSGTTTLFETLSNHPAICPSHKKEPEYFSENQWHSSGHERYEDIFDYRPDHHEFCLEASTGYTKFPSELEIPKKIYDYGLEPYLIYCVRNPLKRMESQYNYLVTRSDQRHWVKYGVVNPYTINTSMYYMQMYQYLCYFKDKNRYIIVDFDEIKDDVVGVSNRICRRLGLSECLNEQSSRRNITPPSSRFEAVMMRLPVPWRKFIPLKVRSMAKKLMRRYDADSKVCLSKSQKENVRDWLGLDMRRFEEEFGFPVSKWGF